MAHDSVHRAEGLAGSVRGSHLPRRARHGGQASKSEANLGLTV